MGAREQLRVRVDDTLVLDAGTCEEVSGPHGPERLIRPPATTLFHQVLPYLKAKPDPPKRPSGSMIGREGVAAAALTVRWGSYLAVLLDHDKPVWSEVHSARTSRISDEEMARINIEASAALAACGSPVCAVGRLERLNMERWSRALAGARARRIKLDR
jgi:hypothetical protein